MRKIAHGVFMWGADERRSDRYGAFLLCPATFRNEIVAKPTFDRELAKDLKGKRVRIKVKVVKSRESGHAGDLHLGIKPSRPEKGEEIDLGVGTFDSETVSWEPLCPTILLRPGDDRDRFWLDPRKLYRLHDQTVDVFVEETTDEFSPRPEVENVRDPSELISNGDGSLQTKTAPLHRVRIPPKVTRLGPGLFCLETPSTAPEGKSLEYTTRTPTVFDRIIEDKD